jgi:hypothetical protein
MKLLTQSAFVHDPSVTFGGHSVISTDPADWHYNGNSQGGIMGGMYMAVSNDVRSGVLGVGGGPYALLLPRSSDFSELFDILKVRYPRSLDRMAILALMQALWDKSDPAGWAGYITPEATPGGPLPPLPGTPSHRVIHHYGLGDHQVTWLGCHAIAASTGAAMFASNVREGNETLSYFDTVPDSAVLTTGNAIVGVDFGFPVNREWGWKGGQGGLCASCVGLLHFSYYSCAPHSWTLYALSTRARLTHTQHTLHPCSSLLRSLYQCAALLWPGCPRVPAPHARPAGSNGALLRHWRDCQHLRRAMHCTGVPLRALGIIEEVGVGIYGE